MDFKSAVFLDLASLHSSDLDLACLESSVGQWTWFDKIKAADIPQALAEADVVVSNKVMLGEKQLKNANNLKLICVSATGTNNIDLTVAKSLGIPVCNVQGYATASVVQHVFSMLLALTTHLEEYKESVHSGQWSRSKQFSLLDFPIRELQGKTFGIVGYGELGKAVAKVAQAFGMQVLIATRNAGDNRDGRLPLHELLQKVDVLSLHCPLNEDTRNLISEKELALMKNDAVLINTARGGLVNESALFDALNNKTLGGAAIDVLEQEPPAESHPLLQTAIPNLIVTPHIAWASVESRQRLVEEIARNIAAFKAGTPRNLVI